MNGRPSGAIWSGRGRVVAIGGLGDALYRRAAVHRGLVRRRARARRYGPREGAAPSLGRSWGWTTPRGEERERGTRQSGSPSRAMTGALGRRSVRTRGEPEREREEGADSVACCGRRGASAGVRGRAEVAGGAWQGRCHTLIFMPQHLS